MNIIVIRHGKVDMKWRRMSTSIQFDEDCSHYDEAPLHKVDKIVDFDIPKAIYISTLKRSKKTAEALFGERDYTITKLINEVPLRSSFNSRVNLPLWLWNAMGRIQWLFGDDRQLESKKETENRADKFIKRLLTANEDCVIVTHGFYMQTFVKRLKFHGFKIQKKRISYSNLDEFIAIR